MSDEEDELARYQAELIASLAKGGTPKEIVSRLLGRGFSPDITRYLADADPRAVEVAALLVGKWSRARRDDA